MKFIYLKTPQFHVFNCIRSVNDINIKFLFQTGHIGIHDCTHHHSINTTHWNGQYISQKNETVKFVLISATYLLHTMVWESFCVLQITYAYIPMVLILSVSLAKVTYKV